MPSEFIGVHLDMSDYIACLRWEVHHYYGLLMMENDQDIILSYIL